MIKYWPKIFIYFLIIVVMVSLVVFVKNDYMLTVIYLSIIFTSMMLKKERTDWLFLGIGFCGTLLGEYFFVSTGVETFHRVSLLGVMPVWLPFLWGYIFLAMKRVFWMLAKDY